MNFNKKSLALHKAKKGKLEIISRVPLKNRVDLSLAYTPGVAAACLEIAKNKKLVNTYTNKQNQVAVVTDGSAVLGLGDIGPEAALPVMEGKAILFKEFGGVDAFPVCLDTQNTEEIINIVKKIAPTFGGINLEDISAPRCFEIEERLIAELNIPIFHDDQHGTAIVVLAGLINASKVARKKLVDMKVVINGAGSAGIAIFKLLKEFGVKKIWMVDSQGVIYLCRKKLNQEKIKVAGVINPSCKLTDKYDPRKLKCQRCERGQLAQLLAGKDIFIGVSRAGLLTAEMVKLMNPQPIIFAMANPNPEIDPAIAKKAGAVIVATGRSDYPNQVNNVLVFPGLFRAVLDLGIKKITDKIKIATAEAISETVKVPNSLNIIPSPFNKNVVKNIYLKIKNLK